MKTIKNNFAIFAFLAAALSAFAFNSTEVDPPRFRQVGNTFVEAIPGTYSCNNSMETCTVELVNDDPKKGEIVEGSETEGTYIQD